jgi:hypothetical protein
VVCCQGWSAVRASHNFPTSRAELLLVAGHDDAISRGIQRGKAFICLAVSGVGPRRDIGSVSLE